MTLLNQAKTALTKLVFNTRHAHARIKKGTVRFKTTDLTNFYREMEAAGVVCVVLVQIAVRMRDVPFLLMVNDKTNCEGRCHCKAAGLHKNKKGYNAVW